MPQPPEHIAKQLSRQHPDKYFVADTGAVFVKGKAFPEKEAEKARLVAQNPGAVKWALRISKMMRALNPKTWFK